MRYQRWFSPAFALFLFGFLLAQLAGAGETTGTGNSQTAVGGSNEFIPLPLSAWANMGFRDEAEGDGKGGWTDQGSQNDLRKFSPSQKAFGGVPFTIVDPEANGGKACVVFQSEHSPFGSPGITIPVNRRCNTLFFLNACAWSQHNGQAAAEAVVTYADGRTESFSFQPGKNTGDWWIKPVPEAEVVWTAGSPETGEIGLYKTTWKLSRSDTVASVTVRPVGNITIFALVGLTAGQVHSNPSLPRIGETCAVSIDHASAFAAIPVEHLMLEMRKNGGDPDDFFDPKKYLQKLSVLAPDGVRTVSAVVSFQRSISPLILVKTSGKTGSYTVKIEEADREENKLTPRAALKHVFGMEALDYRLSDPAEHGVELRVDELLRGNPKGLTRIAYEDSFFLNAVRFALDSAYEGEFTLERPAKVRLLALSRHPENFVNYVWLDIGGQELKVGGNFFYPDSYSWQGGLVLDLAAGTHTFRLRPSVQKKAVLDDFSVAAFRFSDNLHAPLAPQASDEFNALDQAGVYVVGLQRINGAERLVQSGSNPYFRFVAESKSYPDLSYMTAEPLEPRGFARPKGNRFVYANGTEIPELWGCNIGYGEIYNAMRDDRLGSPFFDMMLSRVKRMGYDTVRYMPETLDFKPGHNQNQVIFPLLSTNPPKFTDFFLESFQRMIAGCHKQNLHLFYTLWTDNCCYSDLGTDRHNNSAIVFFHPEAIRRLKEITRMVLSTPNPHRGNIAPINDPTLLIIEIENERNFVEKWKKDSPSDWQKFPKETKEILYQKWVKFLSDKYADFPALQAVYGKVNLRPDVSEQEGFRAVDFPPVWDVKQWGADDSAFNTKLDDLRVSSADFGKNTRSNPAISDGLEFMYVVYRDFLVEMTDFLRSELGYKGIIYANGADTELHYSQRKAVAEVGDAVPGGTGYWNRNGYGFLRDLGWLSPLVFASNSNKPVISREYGPNLCFENVWWGNLITATVQKYMDLPYLFNFSVGIPDLRTTDYLYPIDAEDPVRAKGFIVNLRQERNLHSHFANLACAIAVRAKGYQRSPFRVDIGLPQDNAFYAAPFRGYNKLTIKDYVPFLYAPTRVHSFAGVYDGKADLVVNEPSLPSGDYSSAKHLFLMEPHSDRDRYGKDAQSWSPGGRFQGQGFIDSPEETAAFYHALQEAGYPVPVTLEEFGKVWRSVSEDLEIDTNTQTYTASLPEFDAFIGSLENSTGRMPRRFVATGTGGGWIFLGDYQPQNANSILMANMNGVVSLQETKALDYLFLCGSDLRIKRNQAELFSVLAPRGVSVAVKTEGAKDIADAECLYVTFFRGRSCQTPATVRMNVGSISQIAACDREGNPVGSVDFKQEKGVVTWQNMWGSSARISYYKITKLRQAF